MLITDIVAIVIGILVIIGLCWIASQPTQRGL
jgi:hypothetical protein